MQTSAKDIIDKAGGVTKLSSELGVPFPTVNSWRHRNRIPADRVVQVAEIVNVDPHVIRPDVFPAPASNGARVE